MEVIDTRITSCPESGQWWFTDFDPAKCADSSHPHQLHQLSRHRHREAIALPDGTEVIPVSFDPEDPYLRDRAPDFGLYLDERWQPPWQHDHFDWPDFGIPSDRGALSAALEDVLRRARAGELVELGCIGGHGRTGTALACLAVLTDLPASDALAWVRANYCASAVETEEQEAFVAGHTGR